MLKILIEKELKKVLLGPKFASIFIVCSLLILLSFFTGIKEYYAAIQYYEIASRLETQLINESRSWERLRTRIYRKPDPLSILITGVTNDIGRSSLIDREQPVRLIHSFYSEDTIFGLFRFFDLTHIITIVLSLFAILFTYDAINGEREQGILKLIFSNSISRSQFLIAKLLGTWLGLVIPLIIPFLLGLLLLILYKIPITQDHIYRLLLFCGISILYFTLFVVIGVLGSTIASRSSVSFLVLLVSWLTFVILIPHLGAMIAEQISPIPSEAEIDAQVDAYAKDRWKEYRQAIKDDLLKREQVMSGMSPEERQKYQDDNMWQWMEESEQNRKNVSKSINEMAVKLNEAQLNRRKNQEKLALSLSRFSPASTYLLAAVTLAETGLHLKDAYNQSFENYKKNFFNYAERRNEETGGGHGGIRITVGTDTGINIDTGKDKGFLDVSDRPVFGPPKTSVREIINSLLKETLILLIFCSISLSLSFWSFAKHDIR